MSLSFRVLSAVCVLTLAAIGCQQGKQPGATGKAESKEEAGGGGASKAGKARTRAAGGTSRGAGTAEASAGSRAGGRSTLTADDDGTSLDLRPGQVVTVVLDSNRSSGLRWIMVESGGSVIVREGSPTYVTKSAKAGGGGTETWRFRAAKAGRQTVRLEFRRQWQQVPERTFRFSVTVR